MNRLLHHDLRVRTNKYGLFYNSSDALGFHISNSDISPADKNLSAIKNAKPPRNLKELRSFLGSCNFYRNFIFHFANLCKPLYDVVKNSEDKTFEWTPEAESAFSLIKEKFTSPPVLQNFDETLETILIIDSSKPREVSSLKKERIINCIR